MNQVEYQRLADAGEILLWEVTFDENNPDCKHSLPADWDMGERIPDDPTRCEPRTDPRWQPLTFLYLDRMLHRITVTQVPRCIHEAIGSHKALVEKQTGRKVFYITGGLPGEKAETIYSDVDGALSGQD